MNIFGVGTKKQAAETVVHITQEIINISENGTQFFERGLGVVGLSFLNKTNDEGTCTAEWVFLNPFCDVY